MPLRNVFYRLEQKRTPWLAMHAVLVTFLCAGCSAQPQATSPSVPANASVANPLSKPEDVMEKFYQSLAESNGDAALACTTGDALTREYVDSQVRIHSAFDLLGRKAIERFPEDGKKLQLPPPALLALQKIKSIPVAISGDTATWSGNPAVPLKLVLVNGEWKLDLGNSFTLPEMVRKSNATYNTRAEQLTDIANEMAAGKYDTVELVQQEIKRRGQSIVK